MPQVRSYLKLELPRDIAVQVASYVRTQWPAFIGRGTPLWESTPYPNHCLHFVITDEDVLISHAICSARTIEHAGERYVVYGLSSVFCYQTHRGSGYGEQVVTAATDHIRAQEDADFALLFCGERVRTLYERAGWELIPAPRIYFGDKADPQLMNDGFIMGLFLSDKGRPMRTRLQQEPVFVGPYTW